MIGTMWAPPAEHTSRVGWTLMRLAGRCAETKRAGRGGAGAPPLAAKPTKMTHVNNGENLASLKPVPGSGVHFGAPKEEGRM